MGINKFKLVVAIKENNFPLVTELGLMQILNTLLMVNLKVWSSKNYQISIGIHTKEMN